MRHCTVIFFPCSPYIFRERRRVQFERLLVALKKHILLTQREYPDRHIFLCVLEQHLPRKTYYRGALINAGLKTFIEDIGKPATIIIHDPDIVPDGAMFAEYNGAAKSRSLVPHETQIYKHLNALPPLEGEHVYMTNPDTYIRANGMPNHATPEEAAVELHRRYKALRIPLELNKNAGTFFSTTYGSRARPGASREESGDMRESGIGDVSFELLSKKIKEFAAMTFIQYKFRIA